MQLTNTLMFLHGFIASKTTKSVVFVVLLHLNVSFGCRHYETGYVLDLVGSKSWRTNELPTEGNHVLVKQQRVDRMRWSCQHIILVWANCDRKYCKVLADLWRFSDNWGWVTSNLLITRSQRRLTTRLTWTLAGLLRVWMTFAFQFVSSPKRRWDFEMYVLTSD